MFDDTIETIQIEVLCCWALFVNCKLWLKQSFVAFLLHIYFSFKKLKTSTRLLRKGINSNLKLLTVSNVIDRYETSRMHIVIMYRFKICMISIMLSSAKYASAFTSNHTIKQSYRSMLRIDDMWEEHRHQLTNCVSVLSPIICKKTRKTK